MHYIGRFLLLVILLLSSFTNAVADDFLSPEQAFRASLKRDPNNFIQLEIKIAEGYYLYRDKLAFYAGENKSEPLVVILPDAHEKKYDEVFQKNVAIYRYRLEMQVPLAPELANQVIHLSYQGCADKGLCYAPVQLSVQPLDRSIRANRADENMPSRMDNKTLIEPNPAPQDKPQYKEKAQVNNNLHTLWQARDDSQRLGRMLLTLPTHFLILVVLLLGMLLSFTPCVLPMLPIISAILLGQQTQPTPYRQLILSSTYVLGMALINILLGVLVATIGASLSEYIFNPWVQGAFALLLIWMAGALFGWYEMRLLPASCENFLHRYTHQPQGTGIARALIMGMLAALLIGPCVTPPLAAILLMIADAGSIALGAMLLFFLTLGMGLPLILLAVGAGQLLPRSGPWLARVKYLFAILLLLLAAWFVWLSLPQAYQQRMIQTSTAQPSSKTMPFILIQDIAQLNQYLSNTRTPVMLDFYADWCISCKEMELLTFTDPSVRQSLAHMQLLKIDMTDNTPAHQTLLQHFDLFGPPAILFFNSDGEEIPDSRVIGYQSSEKLVQHIQHISAASQ
jgi:thiol:disulfide interchange protein DsbD